jgi:hypothetical protein
MYVRVCIHTQTHIYTYIYTSTYTAQPQFKTSYDSAFIQACHVEVAFMNPADDPCLRGTLASVVISELVIPWYISTAIKYNNQSIIRVSVTITATDVANYYENISFAIHLMWPILATKLKHRNWCIYIYIYIYE